MAEEELKTNPLQAQAGDDVNEDELKLQGKAPPCVECNLILFDGLRTCLKKPKNYMRNNMFHRLNDNKEPVALEECQCHRHWFCMDQYVKNRLGASAAPEESKREFDNWVSDTEPNAEPVSRNDAMWRRRYPSFRCSTCNKALPTWYLHWLKYFLWFEQLTGDNSLDARKLLIWEHEDPGYEVAYDHVVRAMEREMNERKDTD